MRHIHGVTLYGWQFICWRTYKQWTLLPQEYRMYKQIALEQDGTDLISYRLRVPALSTWIILHEDIRKEESGLSSQGFWKWTWNSCASELTRSSTAAAEKVILIISDWNRRQGESWISFFLLLVWEDLVVISINFYCFYLEPDEEVFQSVQIKLDMHNGFMIFHLLRLIFFHFCIALLVSMDLPKLFTENIVLRL